MAHYHNKTDGLLSKLTVPCSYKGYTKKERSECTVYAIVIVRLWREAAGIFWELASIRTGYFDSWGLPILYHIFKSIRKTVVSYVSHTGWRKKTSRIFARVIQSNGWNESAQKHLCNGQTSVNMCRNFCLKHFFISHEAHDTNKIALQAIKHFLQALHHLCCLS